MNVLFKKISVPEFHFLRLTDMSASSLHREVVLILLVVRLAIGGLTLLALHVKYGLCI